MNEHRQTIYFLLFVAAFLIICMATLFLQPICDDWFFLNYFDNAGEKWSLDSYVWFADNRLLMRDFWRPLEDLLLSAEINKPQLFPYLNHILAVCGTFITAAGVWCICRVIGLRRGMSFAAALTLIFLANSAGAVFSIDSITQTWAAAFGIWSAVAYINTGRWRYPLWLALGLLACFAKETGVVFFICGPVFSLLTGNETVKNIMSRKTLRVILIGIIPAAVYTIVYVIFRHIYNVEYPPADPEITAVCIDGFPDWSVLRLTPMHNNPESYIPLPGIFIKNIAILFFCGVWPIDTVALLYGNWSLAIITALLGFGGVILVISACRQADRQTLRRTALLGGLSVVVALPSLITRAGEISPFTSNAILVIAVFTLINDMKWNTLAKISFCGFAVATLITLTHKYIVAYEAGMQGRSMAEKIKAESPAAPGKVLWIGVDEAPLDAGGAIFTKSAYKGFNHGAAVIREYNYQYPAKLDKLVFPHDYVSESVIDSLVRADIGDYDCIWVTQGNKTKIYRHQ